MIIGGVKCGTSSLYRYINQHPNVLPCKIKEPRIFSTRNVFKTLCKLPWYYQLYPKKKFIGSIEVDWLELSENEQLERSVFKKHKRKGINYITGEASAETLVQAYPLLIKTIFPKIKLIVLLRSPTDRFISHYKMYMRFALEGRKQHQFVELSDYLTKQLNDYKKGNHRNVLAHGIYIVRLNHWLKTFNRDQLHIVKTNKLREPASAQKELNNIFRFLNLNEHNLDQSWKWHNKAQYNIQMTDEKSRLDQFYEPFNKALSQQFNIHF